MRKTLKVNKNVNVEKFIGTIESCKKNWLFYAILYSFGVLPLLKYLTENLYYFIFSLSLFYSLAELLFRFCERCSFDNVDVSHPHFFISSSGSSVLCVYRCCYCCCSSTRYFLLFRFTAYLNGLV